MKKIVSLIVTFVAFMCISAPVKSNLGAKGIMFMDEEAEQDLPDWAIPVEYLESTGTQWIDTRMYAPADAKIEIEFSLVTTTKTIGVFGGRGSSQLWNTCSFFFIAYSTSYFRFDRAGQDTIANSLSMTIDDTSIFHFLYEGRNTQFINLITKEIIDTDIGNASSFPPVSLCLFAVNSNGNVGNQMTGRIYKWRYWEGGVLKQDFCPVRVGEDGYMYDKVLGALFGNQGTGKFIIGPDRM